MKSNQFRPPEPIRTSRYFCTKKFSMQICIIQTSYYEYFPDYRNSKYIGVSPNFALFNLIFSSIFEISQLSHNYRRRLHEVVRPQKKALQKNLFQVSNSKAENLKFLLLSCRRARITEGSVEQWSLVSQHLDASR